MNLRESSIEATNDRPNMANEMELELVSDRNERPMKWFSEGMKDN